MGTTKDETFAAATRQRHLLLDTLEQLPDEAWAAPSLCEGWTVRHVLAHLLSLLEVPVGTWVRRAVAARSFDREADRRAVEFARREPADLVAAYRSLAGQRFAPPVIGPIAPLIDVHVHTCDIELPLGIGPICDPAGLRRSLDFLTEPKLFGLIRQRSVDGVRLEATDIDWSSGTGPVVSGPAASLLMVLNKRRAGLDALEGPGVAVVAGRLG